MMKITKLIVIIIIDNKINDEMNLILRKNTNS